jgi:ribosomal protein S18 acetylase RimI-like enzyme
MAPDMVTIRKMRTGEAGAAKDVICACFIEFWAGEGTTLEEMRRLVDADHGLDDVDDAQAHYFDDGGEFLVVVDGRRIVGTGALSRLSARVCELDRMWLLPPYRRRGIGHRIVRRLFAFARRHGYRTVRLHTNSDLQGAIRFYEGLGFRRIRPYRETKYSDVFMERAL